MHISNYLEVNIKHLSYILASKHGFVLASSLYRFCQAGSYYISGHITSNMYTMGCPPVRGDNPRALASGLSYVLAEKMT